MTYLQMDAIFRGDSRIAPAAHERLNNHGFEGYCF